MSQGGRAEGKRGLAFDPHSLLPLAEMILPRSPKELRAWVLDKCRSIKNVPEAKRSALLHVRPFKEFYEEIFPLSLFAVRHYGDRDDIVCVSNRDDRLDFDARVQEPSRTVNIEITIAPDPEDRLRMEYFLEHGFVAMTGPVAVRGNRKTGRRVVVELEFVDHSDAVASHLQLVKTAAEGKAGAGRYGRGYELVIAVEDSWFEPETDAAPFEAFLKREVLSLPLSFDAVHVVGWTERLFCSLPVVRHPGSGNREEVVDG